MTRQQLKAARESLSLNIGEMAEMINTPRGTYVKWENGARRVPGMLDVLLPLHCYSFCPWRGMTRSEIEKRQQDKHTGGLI